MDRLIDTIDRRIHRLLRRRGVLNDHEEGSIADPWREAEPVLAGIAAASVQGRRALGERAGTTVVRCGASSELSMLAPSGLGPCHARWHGFDLHAAVVIPPRDRAQLERLCRYVLRPLVAQDRLQPTAEGRVALQLRHRWTDGTTAFFTLGLTGVSPGRDDPRRAMGRSALCRGGGQGRSHNGSSDNSLILPIPEI
jgi:putative transposase